MDWNSSWCSWTPNCGTTARCRPLQDSDAERQARLVTLDQKLAELATSLAQSAARYRALDQQRQQRQKDLDSLGQQHRQIEQRRNQRIDQEGPFTWLSDSPTTLVGTAGVRAGPAGRAPADLYQADCRQLLELDDQIRRLLGEIHTGGLTKYQFVGEPEAEITRLVEFAHHLPQEAEALERRCGRRW